MSDHRPETIALHGGQAPDPTTNARAVPIYQTTSYEFDDTQHAADLFALKVPGNIYTRIMNPTWDVLEQRLAALEGGIAALRDSPPARPRSPTPCSTSRAPATTSSRSRTLYGGTYNLFAHTLPQYGIEVRFADPDEPGAVAELVDDKTAPRLRRDDRQPAAATSSTSRAWADAAHAQGLPLIVDNTVPTPICCRVVRPRRRHRRALADEVHRRPRHLDRRRGRRRRQASTGPRTPSASRA